MRTGQVTQVGTRHPGNEDRGVIIEDLLKAVPGSSKSKQTNKPPLATDNLLENIDGGRGWEGGGRGTPSVFSRGGTLLPSMYADVRAMLMPPLFQRPLPLRWSGKR